MPTISSFLRSAKSSPSSEVSSPPNTRCSNCFVFALSAIGAPALYLSCMEILPAASLPVDAACTLDQMNVEPGGCRDETREARHGAIKDQGFAAMIGDDAAGLLDNEHACRQIPFRFCRERDRGISAAASNQSQAIGH